MIPGLIISLGATNTPEGVLSDMAQGRLRLAWQRFEVKRNEGWKILLTGGFGDHFNRSLWTHAELCRKWLAERGAMSGDFVDFALSRHTVEDATLSRQIANRYGAKAIEVVTSDFHVPRARFVFERIFAGWPQQFWGAEWIGRQSEAVRAKLELHERTRVQEMSEKPSRFGLPEFSPGSNAVARS